MIIIISSSSSINLKTALTIGNVNVNRIRLCDECVKILKYINYTFS